MDPIVSPRPAVKPAASKAAPRVVSLQRLRSRIVEGGPCSRPRSHALGARRSALGARRSALGARRSALGARRSALGARRSALGAPSYTVPSPQQPSKSQAHCYAPPESRPVTPAAAMATPPVENAVSLMTFKPLSGRAFIVNSITLLRQRTSLTLPCAVSSGRTPVRGPAGQRPGQVRTSPSVLRHCGGAPSCAPPPAAAASLLPNESRGRAGPAPSDRFPRPAACAQPGRRHGESSSEVFVACVTGARTIPRLSARSIACLALRPARVVVRFLSWSSVARSVLNGWRRFRLESRRGRGGRETRRRRPRGPQGPFGPMRSRAARSAGHVGDVPRLADQQAHDLDGLVRPDEQRPLAVAVAQRSAGEGRPALELPAPEVAC